MRKEPTVRILAAAVSVLFGAGPAMAEKGHDKWIEIQSVSPPVHKPGAAQPLPPSGLQGRGAGNPSMGKEHEVEMDVLVAPAAPAAPPGLKNSSTFKRSTGDEAGKGAAPAAPGGMKAPASNAPQGMVGHKVLSDQVSPRLAPPSAAPAPAAGSFSRGGGGGAGKAN